MGQEPNDDVGLDVIEIRDISGTSYCILNVVDMASCFQQAYIVRESDTHGTPSSQSCLGVFLDGWVRFMGYPKAITVDRGTHNRGAFSRHLTNKGVLIRSAALECPEQIGRVERRNAILKNILNKTIKECNIHSRKGVDLAITEAVNAINSMSHKGGYTPHQWVLGRQRREPGTMINEDERANIGTQQSHATGIFEEQARIRQAARDAFNHWDCSQKVQKALLRNAAPLAGKYSVGDIVSYCRKPRIGEVGTQWSVASRIVGFEHGRGQIWRARAFHFFTIA